MGKRIDLPQKPAGNATDQLEKLYSYLYQTARTINANLDEIGGMEFTDDEMVIVNRILNPEGEEEGTPAYNYKEAETLKSLIIKTANFVQQSLMEYRLNLLGEYVAEGKFGKYVRRTGLDVEITPEHIMQNYQLQEIIQGLKVYEINAKNYIKTGLLRTEQMLPVYGVAIGKDVVTFAEDGTETYNDGNKVAELTADALSFWQGGNMIAKYTGGRISFYYGSTEAFYIQNGKVYAAGDLEIVSGKKLIVTTETFSIDGSGNVIVKGDVSITTGKSLAIKSGGAFTVDSGNFSIDSSGNVVMKGAAEILSGKSLEVKSGGSISIKSGGTFSVDSGNFSIDAQGNATFKGGGTFSGALSAATGTFAGSLSAATGTFAGSLSAATGTFAGTMSAACVTSGTMSCERLSGGTLTLGGNNNTNGTLVIKDASGTQIGKWDKDGISASTGTFAGSLSGATGTFAGSLSAATGTFAGSLSAATGTFAGSLSAATGTFAGTLSAACVTSGTMSCERLSGGNLTLGGNDNTNGVLIIKNASGTQIGKWDKDGISATTGTFSGALSGATGTFAGSLSAATGTFAGSLSAATGTFAGTMSAACVTSGTMSCERLSGGTLTLGGNNNTNGVLLIKNASGTTIGRWDKDGITATTGTFSGALSGATGTFAGSLSAATGTFAGSLSAATGTFAGTMSAACVTSGTMSCERISGGTLTLGGNNNVSGKLVIKNASGTVIGTWDKDGINATTGTFSGALSGATGTFAGSLSAATGTFAGSLSAATGTFAGTLSAACVTSGTMSCERISGGTLTLGGNDNTNGKLVIKNASGTVIGTWDKDGINATTGTFSGSLSGATGTFAGTMSAACVTSGTMSCERLSGGTLTLGGNNNTNGKLIIKNNGGTTVGTWDKDGIVIGSGGSFTMESGSSFTVYSNNMDIDGTGITIKRGVIKGKHYTEDSTPLLSNNDIVVASTAPTGKPGMIWIKPIDSVTVNYSREVTSETNVNGYSSTLTTSGAASAAGGGNSYRLRMTVRAGTSSGSGIDVTITVGNALTFTAHVPPGYYDSEGYHGEKELDLTITNANWYGNNNSLAISISAVGTGGESGMVNYYKIPVGSIQLTATSTNGSRSNWQSCEVKVYQ